MLKRTEWRPFLDLLSPTFFDVVPAGPLLGELKKLYGLYRSGENRTRAILHRSATLAQSGLAVKIDPSAAATSPNGAVTMSARDRGQRVLELYFHQIQDDGLTLLDLRKERFSEDGSELIWNPSSVLADWTPNFREALRSLYRGFYEGDDEVFRRGLGTLGLAQVESAIRAQFGEGQQNAVRFTLRDFQQKFQDVFVQCRDTGSRIDTGFLPLGLYLATLYEHLEALGETFDARAAYVASMHLHRDV